jgi:serine phosphatase RsbU (regulator of sigma subunit)
MARKDTEFRIRGMGLTARFVVSMTAALSLVVLVAGYSLYNTSTQISRQLRSQALEAASAEVIVVGEEGPRTKAQSDRPTRYAGGVESVPVHYEGTGGKVLNGYLFSRTPTEATPIEWVVPVADEDPMERRMRILLSEAIQVSQDPPRYTPVGDEVVHKNGVVSMMVEIGKERRDGTTPKAILFRLPSDPAPVQWIAPQRTDDSTGPFLRIIVAVMLVVVLVGAGVALWAAKQVVRPINDIVEDIRHISKGDLKHQTRARGGGEIELLGRTIDRMTRELQEAQDAELELSIRQREMSLATGVRDALLPVATPLVEGYDIGSAHLQGHFGGDFHDYIELEDGRVGLLVCDVSGDGVPAALIGATARAFLRGELAEGGDVGDAFRAVNRELVRDVRRGMYVTALYVLVDPRAARATVACAGHKVPLLRFTAADEKLRLLHPEGIALGFDKGPVFDRRLEVEEIELGVGDRLLLANSGPVRIANADGVELGEKAFYANVMRRAKQSTPKFLKGVRNVLTEWAGADGPNVDVSLVTVSREE